MIALSHVTKRFGEKIVLRDVSLQLGECGVTAVLGSNGSGKTTLLRILAGLEKKDSGEVVTGIRVAYVFQELRLVPTLTALENVALVLDKQHRVEAIEHLRAVGLEAEADSLPADLSGGMQQRLALARAFAFGGDLLLLDEPFSALDDEWRRKMLDAVRIIAQTRPVVLVTHDMSDVEYLNCKTVRLD